MNRLVSFHLVAATAAASMALTLGSLVEFTPAAPSPAPTVLARRTSTPLVAPAPDLAPAPVTAGFGRSGRPYRLHRGFPLSV